MMIIRAMAVTATQTYEKERIVPLQIFIETLEFVSVCVCVCVWNDVEIQHVCAQSGWTVDTMTAIVPHLDIINVKQHKIEIEVMC